MKNVCDLRGTSSIQFPTNIKVYRLRSIAELETPTPAKYYEYEQYYKLHVINVLNNK